MAENSNEVDTKTGPSLGELVLQPGTIYPQRLSASGRYVSLQPLSVEANADSLWSEISGRPELWEYMAEGPFEDHYCFAQYLAGQAVQPDMLYSAVLVDQRALGYLALMRIEPADRVLEVGNILFSPRLQRTRAATEALFLVARYVFDTLHYRRLEWKCNALNGRSRSAAERFGFQYEGLFRQHRIVKGKNRDTAWYALLDSEWPARQAALKRWLAPENFDKRGKQLLALAECAP